MKKFIIILMIYMVGSTITASAQLHPTMPTRGIIEIINGDSATDSSKIFEVLILNAPNFPEYPNLPRFAIVGKENKFYLSIGATFKGVGTFDWGNPINDPSNFTTSKIPDIAPGNGGKFNATAAQSKFHLNFVALPGNKNQFGLYLSLRFSGGNINSYEAKLKYAYVKYRGFTVGYKSTLYADGAAIPFTIDTEGPNSYSGFSNTGISYDNKFNKNLRGGIGLELPYYSATNTNENSYYHGILGKTNSVSQRVPDIPLYLQYDFNNNGHIRISSIIRTLTYRDNNMGKNCNKIGWGLKLSGNYSLGPIIAYWMGQYSKGAVSYIQDNAGLGIDLVPGSNNPGEMQLTKSWGAFLGLQINFSPKLFSTIIYSHLRNYMGNYPGGTTPYLNQYKWGQYACANIVYSINNFMQCGLEYLYGRKINFDSEQFHDNRLSAMFMVTF